MNSRFRGWSNFSNSGWYKEPFYRIEFHLKMIHDKCCHPNSNVVNRSLEKIK